MFFLQTGDCHNSCYFFARHCQKLTDTTCGEKIVGVFFDKCRALSTLGLPLCPPPPGSRNSNSKLLCVLSFPASNVGTKMNDFMFINLAVKTCLGRVKTRSFYRLSELWMGQVSCSQIRIYSTEFFSINICYNSLTLFRAGPSAVSKVRGGAHCAPPCFLRGLGGCGFKF